MSTKEIYLFTLLAASLSPIQRFGSGALLYFRFVPISASQRSKDARGRILRPQAQALDSCSLGLRSSGSLCECMYVDIYICMCGSIMFGEMYLDFSE